MNKKGFTIIEVTVAIVLLALIGLITATTLIKQDAKSKQLLYESKLDIALSSALKWGNKNIDTIEEVTSEDKEVNECLSFVSIEELINEGYVLSDDESRLIDPRDDTSMNLINVCVVYYNKEIISYIKGNRYQVLSEVIGGGVATSSSLNEDLEATLTVSPNTGYYLASGECNNGYTITGMTTGENVINSQNITVSHTSPNKNATCTFTFNKRSFSVTASVNNASYGSVTSSSTVRYGESTTLTVSPNAGYYIESASCSNDYTISNIDYTYAKKGQAQTVTVSNPSSINNVTCIFNLNLSPTYQVTLTVNGGSTSSTNLQTIDYGSNATFNISANNGYNLNSATVTSGDCTLSSDKSVVTFTSVTSDRSCIINIPIYTYQVSLTCNGCSTTSANPQTVNYNANANWTITASAGYSLTGATTNGCSISGTNVTISNVTSDRSCTINAVLSSCSFSITGLNNYTADYTCDNINGNASMTTCYYGSTACGGISSPFQGCTLEKGYYFMDATIGEICNPELGSDRTWYGGNLPGGLNLCNCEGNKQGSVLSLEYTKTGGNNDSCTFRVVGNNNYSANYECDGNTGIATMVSCFQGNTQCTINGGLGGCTMGTRWHYIDATFDETCDPSMSGQSYSGGGLPPSGICSCKASKLGLEYGSTWTAREGV